MSSADSEFAPQASEKKKKMLNACLSRKDYSKTTKVKVICFFFFFSMWVGVEINLKRGCGVGENNIESCSQLLSALASNNKARKEQCV